MWAGRIRFRPDYQQQQHFKFSSTLDEGPEVEFGLLMPAAPGIDSPA